MPIELENFMGDWRFCRDIQHSDGTSAQVTGTARFHPDAEGLIYDETGQMSLNGAVPLTSARRYLWRPGLRILFEDGRDFHTVPTGGQGAQHWCDPDCYEVRYEFGNWPDWSTHWQVEGPRKSYRMVTRYCRELTGAE